ncbi:MAG TPA: hypothetical protein VE523_01050 [Solirubrobacterales bacterium]|nr:hypothetical protein [Solirubrobacterales bacterium]
MSSKELRQILDEVMRSIDADPEDARRLSGAPAPLRFEFTDLRLALNIAPGATGHLRWDFAQRAKPKARIRLRMDSEVANRLLQGRENAAIAIARGRLRASAADPGAILRVFPAVLPLFSRYRELVAARYPHLAVSGD